MSHEGGGGFVDPEHEGAQGGQGGLVGVDLAQPELRNRAACGREGLPVGAAEGTYSSALAYCGEGR
ncbi:hypothetical protein [Streptomyces griseomycini]|uniref:Uncharacterized protein n=1 Tax=Streptomyces griseomycini TaxID=66895 RepID=A0A7W7PW10_9ACTN|nr:hypothetical protein [Streptomyces griseomycini]MBB4902376.1 hypothetical protein [Streptomyces griseomycini]